MTRYLAILLLLPACFDTGPDGPPVPADPLTCDDLSTRYFAIDQLSIPHDGAGDVTGLDLDHDAEPDNQGGVLLDSVFGIYTEEGAEDAWSAQLQQRFAGDLVWVVELAACGSGAAQVNLHQGVRDGGAVRLADTTPADGEAPSRAATGRAIDARVVAEDGIGVAPLGALADVLGGAEPAWHQGIGVAADLVISDDGVAGTLGFGFAPPYRMVIGESFLGWLNARLAAGQSDYGLILDTDHDGAITYEELDADSVFDLLMRPDLDALDVSSGEYWPGHDGVNDSYSFGVTIHAAAVTVR